MNEKVGNVSFSGEIDSKGFGKKPYSKRLAFTIDQEANSLITKAYKLAEEVLTNNMDKLDLLANRLIEKEVLSYNEVESIIGPPPSGKKNTIDPGSPVTPAA